MASNKLTPLDSRRLMFPDGRYIFAEHQLIADEANRITEAARLRAILEREGGASNWGARRRAGKAPGS